ARDPVDHVAAVGCARGAHAGRIDVWEPRHDVEAFHHVLEWVVAPMLGDRIGELLAVAGRAVKVDGRYDVAARGEHGVVPARAPVVGPRPLWAPVDQVDERILPGRVEPG